MRVSKFSLLMVAAVLAAVCSHAGAEVALTVTSGSGGTPAGGTNHGWHFKANEDILVTDIGLLDDDLVGFDLDYPIGLWSYPDETLLAEGVMSAGAGDTLVDNFRYVDIDDVWLEAGKDYAIAFHTSTDTTDFMILTPDDLVVDPAITWVEGLWEYAGALGVPENPTSLHRIGPNFQFIPEPATLSLLALGGLALLRRR